MTILPVANIGDDRRGVVVCWRRVEGTIGCVRGRRQWLWPWRRRQLARIKHIGSLKVRSLTLTAIHKRLAELIGRGRRAVVITDDWCLVRIRTHRQGAVVLRAALQLGRQYEIKEQTRRLSVWEGIFCPAGKTCIKDRDFEMNVSRTSELRCGDTRPGEAEVGGGRYTEGKRCHGRRA